MGGQIDMRRTNFSTQSYLRTITTMSDTKTRFVKIMSLADVVVAGKRLQGIYIGKMTYSCRHHDDTFTGKHQMITDPNPQITLWGGGGGFKILNISTPQIAFMVRLSSNFVGTCNIYSSWIRLLEKHQLPYLTFRGIFIFLYLDFSLKQTLNF